MCEFLEKNNIFCIRTKLKNSEYCMRHHLIFKDSIIEGKIKERLTRGENGELYIECEGKKYMAKITPEKTITGRILSTGEEKPLTGIDRRFIEKNIYNCKVE